MKYVIIVSDENTNEINNITGTFADRLLAEEYFDKIYKDQIPEIGKVEILSIDSP